MTSANFTVDGSLCPVRLDVYASSVQNISRSRLKSGIRFISVNGKGAKLSSRLKGGEKVAIEWEDPVLENIEAENIPLDILFEDAEITVVNKAQGMVTHPGAGNRSHTLVNALLYHWGRTDKISDLSLRPGIVHRLDKDTSGVLIAAKSRDSEVFLQNEFKCRRVKKEYIAVVVGHPPYLQGEIKNYLCRSASNRKRFTVSKDGERGKFAHSLYRCIGIYGPYSLMRIRIKTGRTHQIRVHMKHLGCPVLGDSVYGKKDAVFEKASLMLHAHKLILTLPPCVQNPPAAQKTAEFIAPVPLRFKKVVKILRQMFTKTDISIRQESVGKCLKGKDVRKG